MAWLFAALMFPIIVPTRQVNPMNNHNSLSRHHPRRHRGFTIRGLAMMAVIGACAAGSAATWAQDTAGNIFGKAPAGSTITALSTTSGLQRQDQADAKGRYKIGPLPTGNYTVTMEESGRPVAKHLNVPVVVGRGIKVDFDCAQGDCAKAANEP